MGYESSSCCVDRLERRRVLKGRKIAEFRALQIARPRDAPHHLRVARARQVVDKSDRLRCERFAERIGDRASELFAQFFALLLTGPEYDETHDRLALHVVGYGYRRRFLHRRMSDERALVLRRSDALPGDVDRVVRAAVDIPKSVGVDARPITMHPDVGEARPIRR